MVVICVENLERLKMAENQETGKAHLISILEFQDGHLETMYGRDGTSEIYLKESTEKQIKAYHDICKLCNKRTWKEVPKKDKCDCEFECDFNWDTLDLKFRKVLKK